MICTSYAHAKRLLAPGNRARSNSEGRKYRKLENNTYVEERSGGTYAIRLHRTDIVTYYPDGTIELDTGGWDTPTTRDRMNTYLPNNVSVRKESECLFVYVSHKRYTFDSIHYHRINPETGLAYRSPSSYNSGELIPDYPREIRHSSGLFSAERKAERPIFIRALYYSRRMKMPNGNERRNTGSWYRNNPSPKRYGQTDILRRNFQTF